MFHFSFLIQVIESYFNLGNFISLLLDSLISDFQLKLPKLGEGALFRKLSQTPQIVAHL